MAITSFPYTLGPYTLQAEIGHGGFATVYVAYHAPSGEMRALKVLNDWLSQPHFIQQFRQEYEGARGLVHPRIVPVLDFGDSDGRHYLAMRLVKGLDLKTRLRSGAMFLVAALEVLAQVAEALDYAHAQGFVHRDVKSANVLLGEKGEAYLTDFGLLRAVEQTVTPEQLNLSGGLAGTAEYMSPEQAKGQPVTKQSDIYSLGVVAYEMLTGILPFNGDALVVLNQHIRDAPPDPRTRNSGLSPAVTVELMRALSKRPVDRPASARAYAAALRAALTTEEQAAAEAALNTRRTREGAIAQYQAQIDLLKQQAAEAELARRQAEAQATRLEAEAAESERILKELEQAKQNAQADAQARERERREAESRAAAARLRLEAADRHLRRGDSPGLKADDWITIPAGEFEFGRPDVGFLKILWDGNGTMRLPVFQIMRAPVTNKQYADFVADTGQAPPSHWLGGQVPRGLQEHPVVNVSWNDAQAFCQWAQCRLPTEWEWEKAARGVDRRRYPWGNESPDASRGNFYHHFLGEVEAVNATTLVGQYSPKGDSPYGCVDMLGNVWEWTASKYDAENYVVRGGSWGYGKKIVGDTNTYNPSAYIVGFSSTLLLGNVPIVEAAYRFVDGPGDRTGDVGFRCAR